MEDTPASSISELLSHFRLPGEREVRFRPRLCTRGSRGAGFSAPPAGSSLLTLPRPTAPPQAIRGLLFPHLSSRGEESRLRLVRCPAQSGARVMKRRSKPRNESVDTLCVTTSQLRTELFPNHWPNTGGKACPATTWAARPTPLNGTHGAPRSPGPQLLAAEEPADAERQLRASLL